MIKHDKKETEYWEYNPGSDIVAQHLPPGRYKPQIQQSMEGLRIIFRRQKLDPSLINFDSGIIRTIYNKIQRFCSTEVKVRYESMKIVHQLGVLLYGPTGTGKTSTAELIIQDVVKDHGAIGLDLTHFQPGNYSMFVEKVRQLSGTTNPIIILVDEIDRYAKDKELLHVLDGSMKMNNVILIGCTNYLEKIPETIKHRKSRMKHVIKVDTLPDAVYRQFIKDKLPNLSDNQVSEIVLHAAEHKLVIDQLKHVLVDYFIDEVPVQQAIEEVTQEFE